MNDSKRCSKHKMNTIDNYITHSKNNNRRVIIALYLFDNRVQPMTPPFPMKYMLKR